MTWNHHTETELLINAKTTSLSSSFIVIVKQITMSDSSSIDVFDFVVKEGNGIKALVVDNGFHTLPHQYIQPLEERFHTTTTIKTASHQSVPVIDVSDWDDPGVAESICEAAIKWGFFQIVNHGVPSDVLDQVMDSAKRFFELPIEERKMYLRANSPSETVCFATSFNPLVEKVMEWKDYLTMLFVDDDQASAFWPPVCREEAREYMKRVEVVIKRLLQVLLKRINVKEEIGKETEYMLMGAMRINFNYYPPCPNPELVAAIGRHSDVSTITVLLQDNTGGLYVCGEGDSWIHVPPIDGALVVNIGDVLQMMSNNLYKSVEHRAVANRNKSRISIPIFVNPGPDALIGPLPQVLENGEKPVYKPIVYSDYFKLFFSKPHDGKNVMEFVKI
ncbi:hypothetical protein FEM48_Zijuj02G0023100 [Ziziphus jujuba var. spinosa]|uniref:Fe2OG dioxygenase domain-containing protein n=1 Tax=Ziziphus jujuba var. spinosa TaxID=714518 RepID=A0A978VT20_ZIZJJ|nr:hypothetical protein FEM48_Zijuj02G0023100 [Ziziphus jujuba var. spinosa]